MEAPILNWILFLGREVTTQEYKAAWELVKDCVPHVTIPYDPTSADSLRQLFAHMLPLLMMRHRRISRRRWHDHQTATGKHWIEQDLDPNVPIPPNRVRAMIGYHLAWEHNIIAMSMTQGRQRDVVYIGMAIKRMQVEPREASVQTYAQSFYHKLTRLEISFIGPDNEEDVILRRLCILLTLKQAYIRAVGQPLGFDWSRLEFNIPDSTATGDHRTLNGWEFRLYKACVGIERKGQVIKEEYQCCSAYFRGHNGVKFVFHDEQKELDSWVQFITTDQLVNVVDKLRD
ncbi:hypothetical protein BJ322DRAFT_1065519 [Thelephora terrestris]|uniref:Uncharacterized protein n=1 Tax=Thelephora terrestris TaxID=56493 RepID=A0A9P6HD28_9AGAM|nr:hypothetical protein BJ322DRAFT_1065519 [Thelephora terrestris]